MGFYPYALSAIAAGGIAYATDTIEVLLVRTGAGQYAYNTGHTGMNFVSAAFRNFGRATLATKAIAISGSAMTIDAADATISNASGTGEFHAMIMLRSAGTEATSIPITYNTLSSAITLNGGNVTLQFNSTGIAAIWATA